MPRVIYICNREKCPDCSYPRCYQTSDVRYAKHFLNFDEDLYAEKEAVIMAEIKTTIENHGAVVDPIETKEIEMTHEEEQKAWNEMERRYEKKPLTEEQKANRRFWNFLEMVYKLARMSGLYIEGHIKVRDKKTGKVWE